MGPSFILREELSASKKSLKKCVVYVSDKPELTNNMFFTLLFAPPPVRYTIHCRCVESLGRPSYQNKYREEKQDGNFINFRAIVSFHSSNVR